MRRSVPFLFATTFLACSAPAAPPHDVATIAPPPPGRASASAGSGPAEPPPIRTTAPADRRFDVASAPVAMDIDDNLGPEPCDFARTYRGTVGDTHVTVSLHLASETSLSGLDHYDTDGAPIRISGSISGGNAFTFSESPGGTFHGTCDASGALRGDFKLGAKTQTFVLLPQPKDWPALYKVRRTAKAEPNDPQCLKDAADDHVVQTSPPGQDYPEILCMPRNPAKRRQVLADAPELMCSADDTGYRVFDLANADAEKRTNAELAATDFDVDAAAIKSCPGGQSRMNGMSLAAVGTRLLTVTAFTSDYFGGAHPMNATTGSTTIDLTTGAEIKLADLMDTHDTQALKNLAGACLPIFARARTAAQGGQPLIVPPDLEPASCGHEIDEGSYLWGCEEYAPDPFAIIVPEGIVIGAWSMPHVSASEEGSGPVIGWDVLLRDRVLRADSPAAFLWSGVAPAAPNAVACSVAYQNTSKLTWTPAAKPAQPAH